MGGFTFAEILSGGGRGTRPWGADVPPAAADAGGCAVGWCLTRVRDGRRGGRNSPGGHTLPVPWPMPGSPAASALRPQVSQCYGSWSLSLPVPYRGQPEARERCADVRKPVRTPWWRLRPSDQGGRAERGGCHHRAARGAGGAARG